MTIFMLILIYAAFIGHGLPHSTFGSAWPVMQTSFSVDFSAVGIITIVTGTSNIMAKLISERIIKLFKTGPTTTFCTAIIVVALVGISFAPSFSWLIAFSIPLGFARGMMDVGLNSYVALHYKSRHMNWMHCCWSLGVSLCPLILAQYIKYGENWRGGFRAIGLLECVLAVVLFFSLSLWNQPQETSTIQANSNFKTPILSLPGAKYTILVGFIYNGIESSPNVLGSSYFVMAKGLSPGEGAQWMSYYFAAIAFGRLLAGFATLRLQGSHIIRLCLITTLFGATLMSSSLPLWACLLGFSLIGLGCGPIIPCLLHEMPARFGRQYAQQLTGYFLASCVLGATLLPPIFGYAVSLGLPMLLFPTMLLILSVIVLAITEQINRIFMK